MEESAKRILEIVGAIESFFLIASIGFAIWLWMKGIAPVLWRLGTGLSRRKIAIFARGDNLSSLRSLLTDSSLFDSKNVIEVTRPEDIGKAESATLYLVFWSDFADSMDDILRRKRDGNALVVYAPRHLGMIPDAMMQTLDSHRNTAVSNFRGRLLNDLVSAMITTSYEKG